MLSPSTAIQRPDLGMYLEEFDLQASRAGFVGQKVMPIFDTPLATANFSRIQLANLLKTYDDTRAPGSGYSRGQGQFVQDNYACKEHGHEEPVDDREAKIYAYTIDAERYATEIARDVVLRNYEIRVAGKIMNTANFTNAAAAALWSNHSGATPVEDGITAIVTIRSAFGVTPNTAIIPWPAFQDLRQCAEIIDRIKYSGKDDPKNITANMVAALWGIEEVWVADAQQNTSNEGQAPTFALGEVWDKTKVFFGKVARTKNLKEVCVGRTFQFTGDGSSMGGAVEMYRHEPNRSNIFRVRMDTDEKLMNTQVGYVLTGVG